MKSVVLILTLAIPSFGYADQSQIEDYVVRTAKFEELVPGTKDQLQWVKTSPRECLYEADTGYQESAGAGDEVRARVGD